MIRSRLAAVLSLALRRAALAVCLLGAVLPGCDTPSRPTHAVLIVLDTLRPDRMSLYGAARPTTPRLDALSEEAVVFDQVVSNASWTLPAMAGLLAGRYLDADVMDERLRVSLVERLQAAGFRTAAFTEGGFVSRRFGFGLGFDDFAERYFRRPFSGAASGEARRRGTEIEETFAAARAWLSEQGDAPFFMFVHTYEPHTPYVRRTYAEGLDPDGLGDEFSVISAALITQAGEPMSVARQEYVSALYDGGVHTADRYVGELLDHIDALGLGDDTLVIVTSDHGESLGTRVPAHPGNHGHALYDELMLVPLIVYDPVTAYPVRRVSEQVRSIDTMPTLLDLLGIDAGGADSSRSGRSLRPLMEGRADAPRPAWMRVSGGAFDASVDLTGVRIGGHKLVVERAGDEEHVSFFDLRADPGELRDLSVARASDAAALREKLEALRGEIEARGVAGLRVDEETAGEQADQLRALGYIE